MPGSSDAWLEDILMRERLKTHHVEALEVAPDVYERLVDTSLPPRIVLPGTMLLEYARDGIPLEVIFVLALGVARVRFGERRKSIEEIVEKLDGLVKRDHSEGKSGGRS
jgi:hypothetical protein